MLWPWRRGALMHIFWDPGDSCHLMRMRRIIDAEVRAGGAHVDRAVSADR